MTIQELTFTLIGMMAKGTAPTTKVALAYGDLGADIEMIFIAADGDNVPCIYLTCQPIEED